MSEPSEPSEPSEYFDFLPSELITIIISELPYFDLNKFSELHENLINWESSFLYKYKEYVRPNYKQFNVKNLYLGFLEIDSNVNSGWNPLYIPNRNNVDINRYIVINNIIEPDEGYVGISGDIFIYDYSKDHLNSVLTLGYAMVDDNLELSEHILKELNDNYFYELFEELNDNYVEQKISIEMTKLILKYLPELYEDILNAIYSISYNYELFKYIINNYEVTKQKILELLSQENTGDNSYKFLITLVNKYYDKIKKELPDIYKRIVDGDIKVDEKLEVITYLANLDIIKKTFHINTDEL